MDLIYAHDTQRPDLCESNAMQDLFVSATQQMPLMLINDVFTNSHEVLTTVSSSLSSICCRHFLSVTGLTELHSR